MNKNRTFENIISNLPQHILDKLNSLKNLKERPDFHPEKNCLEHIKIVTNRCIEFGDPDLIMAAIFHDIHKLDTMRVNPKTGWPTSPGHDKWAQKTIEKDNDVRQFIIDFGADPDTVAGICGQHMRIHQINQMKPAKQKAMIELPFFNKLAVFSAFDDMLVTDEVSQYNALNKFSMANWSAFEGKLHKCFIGKHNRL
jgi:hypothetical protein